MYTRRPPGSVARYRMLKHELRQENPDLAAMVQKTRRRQLEHEGVATVRYTLQALTPLPLYTKIEVTLPPPPAKVSSAAMELNMQHATCNCTVQNIVCVNVFIFRTRQKRVFLRS